MTLAAARFGLVGRLRAEGASASPAEALAEAGTSDANEREPRQIAALRRATEWLNSPPLSATTLLGKVVLVQFGTYTCINWLRTLPYVRAWEPEGTGNGLAVIGVHTPEFAFEKNARERASRCAADEARLPDRGGQRLCDLARLQQPILARALLHRCAWTPPRASLRRGRVQRSEKVIRGLLAETGVTGDDKGVVPIAASGFELQADWRNLKSPEIYLGHGRTENFSSPGGAALGRRRVYAAPTRLALNGWALAGEWTMANEPTILGKAPGRLVCRFHARDVHLVMGPSAPGEPGTLPRVDGRSASRSCSRSGRGRQRQRHRRRTAAVSANPATGADRRSHVRDRVPRCRRGGVRIHVRLILR